mmetsp:Transcript_59250/g.129755  ORF Transcript_59250/g.129755 Transcript_59250/m.129755 type:complete len:223 (-) Transcript_59250:181-849(-)
MLIGDVPLDGPLVDQVGQDTHSLVWGAVVLPFQSDLKRSYADLGGGLPGLGNQALELDAMHVATQVAIDEKLQLLQEEVRPRPNEHDGVLLQPLVKQPDIPLTNSPGQVNKNVKPVFLQPLFAWEDPQPKLAGYQVFQDPPPGLEALLPRGAIAQRPGQLHVRILKFVIEHTVLAPEEEQGHPDAFRDLILVEPALLLIQLNDRINQELTLIDLPQGKIRPQ